MDIEFRRATHDDLELLLAWRNHPKVYEQFAEQTGEIGWHEHVEWWESRTDRNDWMIAIREEGERLRDVGSVNITDTDEKRPEVGVYVGEVTLWGNGIATAALEFTVEWMSEQSYSGARATILEGNTASQRLFEKVGFTRVAESGNREIVYHYEID